MHFLQMRVCGIYVLNKSISTISPTAFTYFVSVCHTLVINTIYQTFYSYICYGDLWSVTFDFTIVIVLGAMNCIVNTGN